jgi:predicted transcriptional regulator
MTKDVLSSFVPAPTRQGRPTSGGTAAIGSFPSTPSRSTASEPTALSVAEAVASYRDGRVSLSGVAAELGLGRTAARRVLTTWGVTVRQRGRPRGRSHLDSLLTKDFLEREYVEAGRSSVELAADVGCTAKTVLRYLARFDIPICDRSHRRLRFPQLGSPAFLQSRYVEAGLTPTAIAEEIGCSRSAVVAALRAAGIRREAPTRATGLTAAYLVDAYVRQGRSTTDIAAEVGCGPTTVARHLRRCGIPVRPRGWAGATVREAASGADTSQDG